MRIEHGETKIVLDDAELGFVEVALDIVLYHCYYDIRYVGEPSVSFRKNGIESMHDVKRLSELCEEILEEL